jgi:NAD(P)-dependent dehydrogenase (short-subunit alcohol dehydrogenase family)
MTMNDKTVLITGANRGIGQALAAEARPLPTSEIAS